MFGLRRIKTATIFPRFDTSTRLSTLMLVVIIAIIIDSEIGYVADFIPERLSSSSGVFTFVVITVIFAITQYHILGYVRISNKEIRQNVIYAYCIKECLLLNTY